NAGVREQCAIALGEYDGIETAKALVVAVVDNDETVAKAAAKAMAELKDPECADAILPFVSHGSAFVRGASLRALRELKRPDTLKAALNALTDPDPLVRAEAVSVIGFLKLEEAIPALKSATSDGDPIVRRAAVSALSFSQVKIANETVIDALRDEDWMVRETAAETAARFPKTPEAATALMTAMSDSYWQVVLKATRSLGKMKIAEAVDMIGPNLALDQSANLRKETAAALGEIAASGSEHYLTPYQDDDDPDVRKTVRWALGQLHAATASDQKS
ncbi:MAG: HEAT repeat domain-containing protein, partial [Pseudomonadota bacterium]